MDAIMEIAKKYNLYVIEDNAQAIGAEYTFQNGTQKKAGTIGHIGCTSFFPSKNLGCFGDGGAIMTNDDELAQRCRMIASHGQSKQYVHDVLGVNSRLDSIQAAILDVKLKYLDQYIQARQKAAEYYDRKFSNHPEIIIPARNPNSTHVFHQYTLQIKNGKRDALRAFLQEQGIPSMIYYPIPLHLQKAYQSPRYKKGDFPVTEMLCASVLSLPMHTELTEDTLEQITNAVLNFFNN
jgi:dTDP-4-amino-4,6-dideoxygalactose transaminase